MNDFNLYEELNDMEFNVDEIEDVSFNLPKGTYPMVVTGIQYRNNKSGTGAFFEVEFKTTSPKEVTLRNYYNVKHVKPDVKKIGMSDFKKLLCATGLPNLKGSEINRLVGKKVAGSLGLREYEGRMYNEIKDIHDPNQVEYTEDQKAKAKAKAEAPQDEMVF